MHCFKSGSSLAKMAVAPLDAPRLLLTPPSAGYVRLIAPPSLFAGFRMSAAVLARRAGRRRLSLLSSLLSVQRGIVSRATLPALDTAVASGLPKPQAVALYNAPQQPSPLAGARGFAAGSGLAGGCFVIRRVPQAAVPSLPASTDGKPSGSLGGLRCASDAAMLQPASPGRAMSTSPSPFCNLAAGGGYSDFEEAPFGHAPSFASSAAVVAGHGSESESEDDEVAVAQVLLSAAWLPVACAENTFLVVDGCGTPSGWPLRQHQHQIASCRYRRPASHFISRQQQPQQPARSFIPTPPTFHIFLQPQVGGHILYGGSRISRASEQRVRKPVEQMEARWIGSATHSGDWSRASTVKPVAEPTTVWGQVCFSS